MLEVRDLTIRYGKKCICENLSFSLAEESITGLVAPNGYGKTSLMLAIGGVGSNRVGSCLADGVRRRASPARYRRMVLYLSDSGRILQPELTVREHLEMTIACWDSGYAWEEVAAACGVLSFCDVIARRLSQGMAQLASLSVAYASGVRYLLFDEPLNGLDQTNISVFTRAVCTLRDRGAGILLSSHYLEGLDALCDSVFFLREGSLYETDIDDQQGCVDLYRQLYETKTEGGLA